MEKTQEQIQQEKAKLLQEKYKAELHLWKQKHDTVYGLVTEDDKVAFLKKPGRMEIAHAETAGDMLGINYISTLLNDCWLGGDDEIRKDVGYLIGLRYKILGLIEIKTGELVKL